MKTNLIRYVSLALLLLWMCVIFTFSAQKAEASGELSSDFAARIVSAFYPGFNDLDEAGRAEILDKLFRPVRKAAHFTEYFILGALSFLFFATFVSLSLRFKVILPSLLGTLYAVSDEVHQLFVDGRAFGVFDIIIDCAGVLLAVTAGAIILRKKRGDGFE